jgi:Protein of unknown function (DUF3572)
MKGDPARGKRDGARHEAAEALAVAALAFLAADPKQLGGFLAATGIGPERIREAARDPHFLAGVLDHLAGDERLVVAFARAEGIDPGEIGRARAALAGAWERDVP